MNKLIINKINVFLVLSACNQNIYSQERINSSFLKKLSSEKSKYSMTNDSVKESINIIFNSSFLLNNSHENLENLNGMAAIKGISSFTSTLFIYNNDNLFYFI